PVVGQCELVANPLHLETIAGIGIAVDLHRCRPHCLATEHQGSQGLSIGAMRGAQNLYPSPARTLLTFDSMSDVTRKYSYSTRTNRPPTSMASKPRPPQ